MIDGSDRHEKNNTRYQFIELGDDLIIFNENYPISKYSKGAFTYDAVTNYSSYNQEMKPSFGVSFANRLCVAGDKRTIS